MVNDFGGRRRDGRTRMGWQQGAGLLKDLVLGPWHLGALGWVVEGGQEWSENSTS